MDISAAALPPIQPVCTPAEKRHPRYPEYRNYVSSVGTLLVTALTFEGWLYQTEDNESYKEVVFNVNWDRVPPSERPDDALTSGWYKNRFAPGHKLVERTGPFPTKIEAERS